MIVAVAGIIVATPSIIIIYWKCIKKKHAVVFTKVQPFSPSDKEDKKPND